MSSKKDLEPKPTPKKGFSRRGFFQGVGITSGVLGSGILEQEAVAAPPAPLGPGEVPITLTINGKPYEATADDSAYAIFELENGVVAQVNSSWCVRVYRDELVEFQVDGTHGSAVAGLRECRVQPRAITPMPVWNPDLPVTEPFRTQWQTVPDNVLGGSGFDNGFKIQWEQFIRHVVEDAPFPYDFLAGARGVQLAELGLESSAKGTRVEVPELSL